MAPDAQPSSHPQATNAIDTRPNPTSPKVHRERTKEDFEKIQLEKYLHHDLVHTAAMLESQETLVKNYTLMREQAEDYKKVREDYRQYFTASRLFGPGYSGYGNGRTDGPPHVLYPHQKPRLGHKKAPKLRLKRKDVALQAEQDEELVPIRLEIDWDKIKLRDTLTWNYRDRIISPEIFAAQMVEDFGLSPPAQTPVMEQIQHQLREQLIDFYPQLNGGEEALDPELPYSAYKNEEMRILIKLNITIGPFTLVDKFEWEINNPSNSPEEFALSLARELSLSGEFTTAIAHSIREQCQLFTRSLFIVGHPFDGRPLEDADLIAGFLPSPLPSVFRPQQQAREYTPILYELTEADLERGEVIYSREQRRQKRSVNRRGGPILPDLKDRQRTVRTLVISSVIPGSAEKVEDSRLYKRDVGPGGKSKRPGAREGDLSEESDSEDSNPESPALALQQGTARTRNMRGAATAAQQRMANIGRSETPEAAALHHHETRTSARRHGGRDTREDSEPPSLIVKLKPGRERMRKFHRGLTSGRSSSSHPPEPLGRTSAAPSTPAAPSAVAPTGSMGPPSTPNPASQSLQPSSTPAAIGQIGRVHAPPPPPAGQPPHVPPPPPAWLKAGLTSLLTQYPGDRFEGVMRYSAVNTATDMPCSAPPPGPIPEGIKYMYLPRIRCHDCPGKLYTPGPERTVGNFEVHLKNRQHRERVDARKAADGDVGQSS
ncbi:related to transcription factor snf5p [Rhynchosporium agropyri]|uniref:Related to transcription factor snf5p n=1 Tax=Rhynchosporium agropyri TaxID=914238 RepID=A0A1E1L1N9_9HELO|nr:related to transcription factor snf5p [Rhynchosporium agropyri]